MTVPQEVGRVHPYLVGICAASVCTAVDATREEIELAVNGSHPTGISSPWRISDRETFANGSTNPCPCNLEPESRRHWLLEC